MGAFTTVLCATDLSEGGDEAIRAAAGVARLHGAALTVVHALPGTGAPMTPAGVERTLLEREELGAQLGDRILERVTRLTGVPREQVAVHIEDGPPDVAIARAAAGLNADLVVVGATGTTGVRRLFLGSTAAKVLRTVPTTALVGRPRREGGAVLYAADFSQASEAAGRVAFEEARLRRVNLTVLHSVQVLSPEIDIGSAGTMPTLAFGTYPLEDMQAAARQRLAEVVEKLRFSAGAHGAGHPAVSLQVEAGPPAPVIVSTAETIGADLVVLGTAHRRGLDRLLLGSVAEDVVRDAHCSVLAVRRATLAG